MGKNLDIKTLSAAFVVAETGNPVKMGTFWKDQSAILVFLRHFGCIACRAHATQFWAERAKFESKGCKIVFIGNGPPGMIKAFKEDMNINAPVYSDPGLAVYELAGFKRGVFRTIGPKALLEAFKLKQQGHTQPSLKAQGDPWQQGGVLALNPQGQILFHFISEYLGDFPESKEMDQAVSSQTSTTTSPPI